MNTDRMIKKDYSIRMNKAQIRALPFVMAGILPAIPFGLTWGWKTLSEGFDSFFTLPVFIPVFLSGILLHELIHAFTWKWLASLSRDQLKLGVQWKTLTPYAHSKVPMMLAPYRWGAVMPLLLVGVLPFMVSLASGNGFLAIFGIIFMSAAAGDMLILWMLRKLPTECMVEDHPTAAGCYVYEYPSV